MVSPSPSHAGSAADEALAAALKSQRRLNVDEYHRMIDAGVLNEDERVELVGHRRGRSTLE